MEAGTFTIEQPMKTVDEINNKKQPWSLGVDKFKKRVKGIEPSTSSLGSWRSTAELHPQGSV